MHLIDLAVVHDSHPRMIKRKMIDFHDIHILIGPERRIFHAVLLHHIKRRIMGVIFVNDTPREIRHTQYNSRRHNIPRTQEILQAGRSCQPLLYLLHGKTDFRFRFMVKGKICSHAHDERRNHQDNEQDGCIKTGNLGRNLHAP